MPANGNAYIIRYPHQNKYSSCPRISNCALTISHVPPTCKLHNYQIHLPFTPNLSHILTNLFAYTLDHIFLIPVHTINIPYPLPFSISHTPSEHLVVYANIWEGNLTCKNQVGILGTTGWIWRSPGVDGYIPPSFLIPPTSNFPNIRVLTKKTAAFGIAHRPGAEYASQNWH